MNGRLGSGNLLVGTKLLGVFTMTNQFLALKAKRLAEATRVFNARGKSVVRCDRCQLAERACICLYCPESSCKSHFVLLMHHNEVFKPTNTGRLIADVFPASTQVSCWSRTQPEPNLLELLKQPDRRCYIVFPENVDHHPSAEVLPEDGKTNTFILLDGTWKQARRMLTLSRWLDGIPTLAFPESLLRGYAVRKSEHLHQVSTAEAGGLCLQLANEPLQANKLFDYFKIFNLHYLATRGSYHPELTDLHEKLLRRK